MFLVEMKQMLPMRKMLMSIFYRNLLVHYLIYSFVNENEFDIRKISNPRQSFQDGGRYHIETSPLICRANQWTGFYIITASVLKGLRELCQDIVS